MNDADVRALRAEIERHFDWWIEYLGLSIEHALERTVAHLVVCLQWTANYGQQRPRWRDKAKAEKARSAKREVA